MADVTNSRVRRKRERDIERETELERGYNIIVLGEQGPQTAGGPRREINAFGLSVA